MSQSKKTGIQISFEVFPPKKEGDFSTALQTLDQLATMDPTFISVTYGAGGSKTGKTIELASFIQNTLHINALAHVTCVGFQKKDLLSVYEELKKVNVSRILALRGDRPQTMTDEQYNSRDFAYASEMIGFLKENTDLEIACACYPEKHFEATTIDEDLVHLKEKIQNGATSMISQMFFDNTALYRFLEKLQPLNIDVPLEAGIMPITSAKQLGTSVSLSGSSVPKKLADLIATYGDDPADMRKAGIDYAINQIRDLEANGVKAVHIYTMNKAAHAAEILAGLN
ncbi:MAG: methylenetetrahydrofolate reductase [NAD(P)H] [Lachnospiraceae bacterium]|nr:methylenetetrahydrofolate reductase [NAD(P)H] [Lachnospiraceae bacterium]